MKHHKRLLTLLERAKYVDSIDTIGFASNQLVTEKIDQEVSDVE